MHGVIFAELKKYCEARVGAVGWNHLLEQSGMPGRTFLVIESYPDQDALALVGAASRLMHEDQSAVLEDFGGFITPDLMAMYGSLVDPAWRTLEFLEHVENTIHRVVRFRNPGAKPPELKCSSSGAEQVTIDYSSSRKLCALARGLIHGVARHYAEAVRISEPECMLKGGRSCKLIVDRLP